MKRKIALIMMLAFTSLAANAQGMVYDPTEFQSKTSVTNAKENVKSTQTAKNNSVTNKILSEQAVNFNNALLELDNAQVNIRNQLLEYQSKYQEIDTQYKLLKEQRRVLSSQIRAINRKVNSIEKSKNQIRKSMS